MEGVALQSFCRQPKQADEERAKESVSVCDGRGPMVLQVKVDKPEPIAGDIHRNRKTGSRRWTRRDRKIGGKRRKWKWVARPKAKLVVGTKMLYKRNFGQDGEDFDLPPPSGRSPLYCGVSDGVSSCVMLRRSSSR